MSIIMIDDVSFNSDAIKVVQRVIIEGTYAVQFYVNIGDIGRKFEIKFNDLLDKDDKASKIAYDFLLCYIVNKRSGIINLVTLMNSLSKLYRETLVTYSETSIDMNELQKLRESILKDYLSSLTKLAESLL